MTPAIPARLSVYVGHGNATGDIEIFGFDRESAALSPRAVVASGSSTSFFALHPTRRFAYTTHNRSERVTAFAFDGATGLLHALGDAVVPPRGTEPEVGPAYLAVDASGQYLVVANYRGHNTVVFRLHADGTIGPLVSNVTSGTHAHCVAIAPGNRHVFVPTLGADVIAQYTLDAATGALSPNQPATVATAPGAGPRHMVFAPSGQQAFVVNELDATLSSFAYDSDRGVLTPLTTVATLPSDYDGRRWAGDIQIHPNGRWLYVSNRAHDSLAVFEVADHGRVLALVTRTPCGGKTPRNFTLDPAGEHLFCANQDSANVVIFAIDARTGHLAQRADHAVAPAPYFVRVIDLG
ncbi:MAG TPA: lactonase family protein [Polyangia bacterium]